MRFDGLTRLAQRHFGVVMALITRFDADRQRVESYSARALTQAPPDLSFFERVILGDDVLVVPDTRADDAAHDPLLIGKSHIRFYAGCPLIASTGIKLGTFCLFGNRPRTLNDEQREFLQDLAGLAAAIIERDAAEARQKEEEDNLRESARRMALAIAGSSTGIWDRNILTNEIHYSTGWKAMLGYADSEVTNLINDSYKRVHPDDLAYVQATIKAHFEQKTESYEVEHRIRCKDGSYKWVSSRGKVVSRDGEGEPLRMIGTTTDITAMRMMSEKLQQTVDLVTSLTNEVPGLVFQHRRTPTGVSSFSYVSAGVGDIYELTQEQVADDAAAVIAVIHPDDLPVYLASLDSSAAQLSPWHLEYRVCLPRQGLRWRQGVARPQRLEDGSTLWHGFITDVTERKRIEAELQDFATIDFLTQLANRRQFMLLAEAELARIRRSNGPSAAVLICDLDHFKSINDSWGHAVGDTALKHFSAVLREQLRKTDIAGRVGGEEFAVVLSDTDFATATVFAERMQQRIAETPLFEAGQRIALTVSVGITLMNPTDASAHAALSRSDVALYRAKEHGRNRIERY